MTDTGEFPQMTSDDLRYEVIDSAELAKRWSLPESWIREQTRSRASDPSPCLRFGKYVRFAWGSSGLTEWLARHSHK